MAEENILNEINTLKKRIEEYELRIEGFRTKTKILEEKLTTISGRYNKLKKYAIPTWYTSECYLDHKIISVYIPFTDAVYMVKPYIMVIRNILLCNSRIISSLPEPVTIPKQLWLGFQVMDKNVISGVLFERKYGRFIPFDTAHTRGYGICATYDRVCNNLSDFLKIYNQVKTCFETINLSSIYGGHGYDPKSCEYSDPFREIFWNILDNLPYSEVGFCPECKYVLINNRCIYDSD